jgi:hypothetical protein
MMNHEIAVKIVRLFRDANVEAWDLHAFFELSAGDDGSRHEAVLDTVDRLVASGYLESRGSDFFTLTEKGREAALTGILQI